MKVVVGQGSCGIATGAKKTAAEFERLIAEKNLDVKVDVTGCVGTCYLEPIVDIYDDNGEMTRYVKVKPEKVEAIVESHLVNHNKYEEQAITAEDEQFVAKQQRVVLRNCGVINPKNIDEYTPAIKPINNAILNSNIALIPKHNNTVIGINVESEVKIVLNKVSFTLIFTSFHTSSFVFKLPLNSFSIFSRILSNNTIVSFIE